MLTDEEADKIRREVEAGVRGPVLLKWIRELRGDRDERLGRPRPGSPEGTDGRGLPQPPCSLLPGRSSSDSDLGGGSRVLPWLGPV